MAQFKHCIQKKTWYSSSQGIAKCVYVEYDAHLLHWCSVHECFSLASLTTSLSTHLYYRHRDLSLNYFSFPRILSWPPQLARFTFWTFELGRVRLRANRQSGKSAPCNPCWLWQHWQRGFPQSGPRQLPLLVTSSPQYNVASIQMGKIADLFCSNSSLPIQSLVAVCRTKAWKSSTNLAKNLSKIVATCVI